MIMLFSDLEFSAEDDEDDFVENDEAEQTEDEVVQIEDSPKKSDFVDPLSYIGLKPPSNSFDLFYLCKFVSKHN